MQYHNICVRLNNAKLWQIVFVLMLLVGYNQEFIRITENIHRIHTTHIYTYKYRADV